jgi:hypothetical protein
MTLSRRSLCLAFAGLGALIQSPAFAQGWRTYANPRFGTTIDYPDQFRPGRPPQNGAGLAFTGADGATFSVYGSHNSLDHDLKGLEAFIRETRNAGEKTTYEARGPNWFVIAGTSGNSIVYERHLLSHGGKIVNGFTMQYPASRRTAYDAIVTRMSRSFRAGRGADTEGTP